MNNIEFFTIDERVYISRPEGKIEEITENHEIINDILESVENFYPLAFSSLNEWYAKSMRNASYAKFLMARRFIKCNFGELDCTEKDLDREGSFHFEKVKCPMRGECKYENKVCLPKFNSRLSKAEIRVMELFYRDKDIEKIADKLFLSGHTVKNHIRSAYTKLGIHSRSEFISYANRNHLFD